MLRYQLLPYPNFQLDVLEAYSTNPNRTLLTKLSGKLIGKKFGDNYIIDITDSTDSEAIAAISKPFRRRECTRGEYIRDLYFNAVVYDLYPGAIIGGARITSYNEASILAKDDSFGLDKMITIPIKADYNDPEDVEMFKSLGYINVMSPEAREDRISNVCTVVGRIHFYQKGLKTKSAVLKSTSIPMTETKYERKLDKEGWLIKQLGILTHKNIVTYYRKMDAKPFHKQICELFDGQEKLELAAIGENFGSVGFKSEGKTEYDELIRSGFKKGKVPVYIAEQASVTSMDELADAVKKSHMMIAAVANEPGDVFIRVPCVPITTQTIDLLTILRNRYSIIIMRPATAKLLSLECWIYFSKVNDNKVVIPDADEFLSSETRSAKTHDLVDFQQACLADYISSISSLYGITKIFETDAQQLMSTPLAKYYGKKKAETLQTYITE